MDARLLKEQALQFFQKAEFAKAADVWGEVCRADPKDNQSRLRLGEALAKAGQVEKAFEAYRAAAEGFAEARFLPQATAAAKLALGLKPDAAEVQALVAGFHAERFGRPQTPSSRVGTDLHYPLFASSPSRGRASGPRVLAPGPPPFLSSPSARATPSGSAAPSDWDSASASGEFESHVDEALGFAQGEPPADEMVPPPSPPDLTSPPTPRPVRRPPFRLVRPPTDPVAEPDAAPGDECVAALADELADECVAELAAEPAEPVVLEAELVDAAPGADLVPPPPPPPSVPVPPPVAEAGEVLDPLPPLREPELGGPPNPNATRLANISLMEELRVRSAAQDSTVVAVNPFALGPPPPMSPEQCRPEKAEGNGVPLLEALSSEAFLALLKECPLREYSMHEVVLEQGRPGNSFFVILAGRVRVFREEGSGRRELAILEEGAFFGEMALLTGAPRSAWVVAEVDDTRLLEIPSATVRRLSIRYPSVAEGMASLVRKRILSNVMGSEPLFAGLKRNERQALADRFEAREAESGEVLMSQGAAPAGLVVAVSGRLKRAGRDGTPRHYGPGTLVGDLDTLEGVVAETVEVLRRGLILSLPPEEVGRLLTHPSLAGRQSALIEAARRRLGV